MLKSHSFETIESCTMDALTEVARNGNATWDDDMGIVTDNEDGDETGILILPPGPAPTTREGHQTPLSLSVPESLPSNIGSIHLHRNVPQQVEDKTKHMEYPTKTKDETLFFRVSLVLLLVASFIVTLVFPTYAMRAERNELLSTTLRLENEIRSLKSQIKDINYQQTEFYKKQQQQQPRTPPTPPKKPLLFTWEKPTCSAGAGQKVMDNCWVRADANLELGECAYKTKEQLQEGVKHLSKSFWNAQEELKKKMRDFKEQFEETSFYQSYVNTSTSSPPPPAQEEQPEPPPTFPLYDVIKTKYQSFLEEQEDMSPKRREQMNKIANTAKSVLSGVAFATAATLIVSGSFLFGGSNDD